MSVFKIGGLASGINFNDIVDQLMLIERRPIRQLEDKKKALGWKKEAWTEIDTVLDNLNASLQSLLKKSTMMARTTSTTDDEKATATATSDAALATYIINVSTLATSTKLTGGDGASDVGIGGIIDAGAAVSSLSSKFQLNPTEGTFTVNGAVFELLDTDDDNIIDKIEVDAASDYSLSNASGITLNNIITAFNDENVRTAAGLRASGEGVAAEYNSTTDKFALYSANGGTLRLGSGGDTSNFLTAVGLYNASGATDAGITSKSSVSHLGAIRTSQILSDANLSTAITDSTGSFKINGVEITWNKSTDSLANVISRINSSTAGVTATYDSIQDRLVLTNKTTGSTTITREDVGTGNFLAAMDLLTNATESTGSDASFTIAGINGGNAITSKSNDVSGIVAGVTFNLKETTASAISVTISQDKTKAKDAIKAFIDKYNAAMTLVNAKLGEEKVKDATLDTDKKKGLLRGDRILTDLKMKLPNKSTSIVAGLSSTLDQLAEIGITLSSDNYGKDNLLVLNESTLDAKLDDNPAAVGNIFFNDEDGDGEIDPDEDGVASRMTTYLDRQVEDGGKTKTLRYQNDNTNVSYTGTWSEVEDSGASGSTLKRSSTSSDYVNLTFKGTKVTWYSIKGSDKGIANVYIDDVLQESIDLYYNGSAQYLQSVYTKTGLSDAEHTIKIEVSGTKNASSSDYAIDMDAIDVAYTTKDGTIVSKKSIMDDEIEDIDDTIERMETRLSKREETLIKQFTAMETIISRYQQMSGRLQMQISSMSQ